MVSGDAGKITFKVEADTQQAEEAVRRLRREFEAMATVKDRTFRRRLLMIVIALSGLALGLAIGLVCS